MRLDIALLPPEIEALDLEGKTAIVVDVLRATSTIVTAIANGARCVLPCLSPEEALRAKSADPENVLACGEREGKAVEGFDLGNSPLEYSPERVRGKAVALTTTNGTRALRLCSSKRARRVLIGSFLNLSALCERVARSEDEITIVCSGKEERFGLEDAVFAGFCVFKLEDLLDDLELSDSAIAAKALAERFSDIVRMFLTSEHGRYLAGIGFQEDLRFCAKVDLLEIVPEYLVEENCLRERDETDH
jgi:2-phosphosulfolactate phosphatase